MNLLRPTACDLMVYKNYKISLKFFFRVCRINLRIQHLSCHFNNHPVTVYHNISLKSLPCNFPHRIFHQLLIIYFLINDLLPSKFLWARHTGRAIWTKNNIFVHCESLMASSSSSLVFIQFRGGILNFFASSDKDVLFIY